MLGPGSFDWPILSDGLSTRGRPSNDIRVTRSGVALARYLEKQEARRTTTESSHRTRPTQFFLRASAWLLHVWRPARTRVIQSPQ